MDLVVNSIPIVSYWSEDLCCTIPTHLGDLKVKVMDFEIFKFLVKVFRCTSLLNMWMDLVDTLPVVRYWSDVSCCTVLIHINDLEIRVVDFKNFKFKYLVKVFRYLDDRSLEHVNGSTCS